MKAIGSKLINFLNTIDDKGFTYEVDYDAESGYYLVCVISPNGKIGTDTFKRVRIPVSGMDIYDVDIASEIAKRLAKRLEENN